MSLLSSYQKRFTLLRVYKERGPLVSKFQNTRSGKNFIIGPVTPAHAGIYRCHGFYHYFSTRSALSDPLEIVVTGVYRKPSLLAQPDPLVKLGENATLQCCSEIMFDTYILYKGEETKDPLRLTGRLHGGGSQADFSLGSMTLAHVGTYRCYGSLSHSPYEWSVPSDPLKLVITGLHKKPSLFAQLGSLVKSGENVTLRCHSESSFDTYHLSRKEDTHEYWLHGVQSHNGAFQADFFLGPVTPAHGGIYRCYGSFNRSPYVWSDPSDPLPLLVTGEEVLYLPHVLSLELDGQKNSTSSSPTPTKPSNQAVATILNREPEVDRVVNREDHEAEDPQEVTYSELSHWIPQQKIITPTSEDSEDPSTDSIVYVELSLR
ncbi:killer cell immunoglobulin-like receptor 3DL2 [Trichechus inunguis]